MRSFSGFRISIIGLLVLNFAISSISGLAQGADTEATPVPDPSPMFALVAVGDYPDGYFEDVVVEPGASVDLTVAVINTGQVPVRLKVYTVNALSGVNGGYTSGAETDEPMEWTRWVEFPTQYLELVPGEQRDVTFSVSVPTDAKPGQYISGLVAETDSTMPIPGSEIFDYTMGYAISVGILVPGEVEASFALDQPEVEFAGGVNRLRVPVTNTGNYLVRPAGKLTLTNSAGDEVITSPVQMNSVYSGLTTFLEIVLVGQMEPGDYILELELVDKASGATDSIDGAEVTVPEPADPTGVSVISGSIEPNAEEIVFANVDVTLNNGGQQIPASNVTLEVTRDGEQVDSFPLATNQVLLSGENQFVTRYLPADMWQSGEYTFSIKVSAVDPNGGQETILLDEELDATIVVP